MQDLEIFSYEGEGYQRTMHFESWRVAIANFGPHFDAERYRYLERHLLTDEAFVLLDGSAVLHTDDQSLELELFKVYNVPRETWHHIVVSRDAKVLVVENRSTSKENTEKRYLNE